MEKNCFSCNHTMLSKTPKCLNCHNYSNWEPKPFAGFPELREVTPSYYNYSYKGIKLDPYRVAKIYGIKDNMQFHIFKKAARLHKENHKDLKTNLEDIIKTAQRWLEMIKEDEI